MSESSRPPPVLDLGRTPDGSENSRVAGAAAELTSYRVAELVVGHRRRVSVDRERGHQKAGGAEPALQPMMLAEGLLKRMELTVGPGQSFDGTYIGSLGLKGEHQTRSGRVAVHEDGAAPAHPVLAAHVRSRQPDE